MPRKRYSKLTGDSVVNPMIREAKAEAYGRGRDQKEFLQNTLNITSLKRKLKRPVKRSKEEIAWALGIAGIGEGPADLSRNMREYLSSNK